MYHNHHNALLADVSQPMTFLASSFLRLKLKSDDLRRECTLADHGSHGDVQPKHVTVNITIWITLSAAGSFLSQFLRNDNYNNLSEVMKVVRTYELNQ